MRFVMLALYDAKIGAYMTPFFAQSKGAAVRSLSDLVNGTGGEPPARHPEDFKLVLLGYWNDSGDVEVVEPELVCECVSLKGG